MGGAVYIALIAFAVEGKEYVAIAPGSGIYAFGLPYWKPGSWQGRRHRFLMSAALPGFCTPAGRKASGLGNEENVRKLRSDARHGLANLKKH